MKIEEMRQKYSLTKDDVWSLERSGKHVAWVLKHDAVLSIGNQEGITFDKPEVLESPERSPVQRIALLVAAVSADGKRRVYDIGEADKTNCKIPYHWAMALKRGQDRSVLKMIAAEGVYSEEEADDFKRKDKAETVTTEEIADQVPLAKPVISFPKPVPKPKPTITTEQADANVSQAAAILGGTVTKGEATKECPKCGSNMAKKSGKFGEFWGCTSYPKCKSIVNIKSVSADQY